MWMAPENRWTRGGGHEDEHVFPRPYSDATARTFPMTYQLYRHQGCAGAEKEMGGVTGGW
jgi:hypothetical protein